MKKSNTENLIMKLMESFSENSLHLMPILNGTKLFECKKTSQEK